MPPIQYQFATAIYSEPLLKRDLARFNRDLLKQCRLVRETDPEGQEWSEKHYPHGYTSYGSISDLHLRYPPFEDLAKHIDKHVARFARSLDMDLLGGSLAMTSCWVNIMPANAAHSLHLHPLSVISGTYYVSVPPGASSLKIEDPRLDRMMAAPPKRDDVRDRNKLHLELKPKDGTVALWESWLRHEVPPNRSKQERVSISFNYEWK
jgi:uncharacterized protein (TIGR02466 family)